MVEDIDLFLQCHKAHFYFTQRSFPQQTDFCMYTYFYRRRAKSESPVMAPRKASKASAEISGQGSDNVSDTSPRSVDSIRTWSYISRFCSPNW
jgi:hypothetical protein